MNLLEEQMMKMQAQSQANTPFYGALGGVPYAYPTNQSNRDLLNAKLSHNIAMISNMELQNKEIKEALDLLDQHPWKEKFDDIMRKLFGR